MLSSLQSYNLSLHYEDVNSAACAAAFIVFLQRSCSAAQSFQNVCRLVEACRAKHIFTGFSNTFTGKIGRKNKYLPENTEHHFHLHCSFLCFRYFRVPVIRLRYRTIGNSLNRLSVGSHHRLDWF